MVYTVEITWEDTQTGEQPGGIERGEKPRAGSPNSHLLDLEFLPRQSEQRAEAIMGDGVVALCQLKTSFCLRTTG